MEQLPIIRYTFLVMPKFKFNFFRESDNNWYEVKSHQPLNHYIIETFANLCTSSYFRCMRLQDQEREYFLHYCATNDTLTLKIFVL